MGDGRVLCQERILRRARHYYAKVIDDYPDTKLAEMSKGRVTEFAAEPATPTPPFEWVAKLLPESKKVGPTISPARNQSGGRSGPTNVARAATGRRFQSLRRCEQPRQNRVDLSDCEAIRAHSRQNCATGVARRGTAVFAASGIAAYAGRMVHRRNLGLQRLRGLPVWCCDALSAGHPNGVRSGVRVGQLPPQPGRVSHRSGRQGNRKQDALQGRWLAQRR